MNQKNFDAVYKQKLLDTFRFLIDFLNKNNLRWWAAYGTIIGAIRHHGLIPWDDDIDIYMPREDYEKLISLKNEMLNSSNGNYGVEHVSIDADYAARFAKVMDLNTTIQAKRFIPSIMGVFIDIFPLDSSNDDVKVILCSRKTVYDAWSNYFDYVKHYSLSDIMNGGFSFRRTCVMLNANIKKNSEAKHRALQKALQLEKEVSKTSFDKSNYCFSLYGVYNERDIYKTAWFNGYQEELFEDFIIRIPIGYDMLLTQLYGDYMTPPPVEKRIPRHKPYYINLRERLTLQEIGKRVMSGETEVY